MLEELKTSRLLLRSLTLEDAKDLYHLRYHPEVLKYIKRKKVKHVSEIQQYIAERIQDTLDEKIYYWGIADPKDSKLMGTICLWNINNIKTVAEVGYELHPDYHKKGFMSEAMSAVLNFGFKTLQLNAIEAFTNKHNEGSIKMLNSFDFKRDAHRKDEGFPNNLIYIKAHA